MQGELPPLMIIAPYSDSFDLKMFLQSKRVQKHGNRLGGKFPSLNKFEIIADGLSYIVQLFDIDETNGILESSCSTTLFSANPKEESISLGISLGEHIEDGKHLPTINRALLNLAKCLGEELGATYIAWIPAEHSIDFEHFREAVADYLAGGPTPVLVQIAIISNENEILRTRGLTYFSAQEIELEFPTNMSDGEAIKRLVRICHDISVNGKIDNKIESEGLDTNERIFFEPSHDLKNLSVKIVFT